MAIKKISANLLGSNAVLTANIAGGAISAADIADNSITAAKISASTSPTFGGLTLGTDSSGGNISLKNSDYGNTGLARFYGTDGNEKLQIAANANTQAVLYTFSGVSLDFEIGTNTSTLHLKSTGKVGVGTNDPGTQLEIRTDTSSTTFGDYPALTIRNDNTTGVGVIHFNEGSTQRARIESHNNSGSPYLIINTTSAVDNGIYINSSGFVGIGTSSPVAPLTVNDKATISFNSNDFSLGHHLYYDSVSDRWERLTGNAGSAYYQTAGTHIWYRTSAGGATGDAVTPTESMRIDSSGNLSMGSSTAATAYFIIDKATTGENGILFKNAGNNKIKLIQSAAEELEVYVNNTKLALVIAESGIADFGTTGALRIPRGTTGQRPTGAAGYIRYNTTTEKYEVYDYGASQWTDLKTDPSISFVNPTTYFTDRFAISADGQSADADNSSGYGVVSTNINFEGNFTLITKWAHDYMGIGIGYKAGIQNSNFTGESADGAGPYGGNSNVDGFDSTVSYMGQYHWPVSGGGNDDHQTTWYIKHQRSGNTISTHYSTNSNAADDPLHSSWTQVQSTTINTSDHCKPIWGEASSNENQILTFTYKDVTGGYNFS